MCESGSHRGEGGGVGGPRMLIVGGASPGRNAGYLNARHLDHSYRMTHFEASQGADRLILGLFGRSPCLRIFWP